MSIVDVPEALAKRLGDEGTQGLVTLLDSSRQDWTEAVLTTAVDRFEYRLTSEVSALRLDVTKELSGLRQDVTREIATVRVEWLKWSFLFWIGQVAAMAGLLAFMLRR